MSSNTTTSAPARERSHGGSLLDAFLLGLSDIADPAILLGEDDAYPVDVDPEASLARDRDSIAGDWQRVGGYLASAIKTESAHGKE